MVQRARNSANALIDQPSPPISRSLLNNVSTFAGILGVVLSILPAFGLLVSPWLIVGVLAVAVGTLIASFFNENAAERARERARAEHQAAIIALLQRAEEVRAALAAQARAAAHVTLDVPTAPQQ